ncbi:MAG: hypothetical protein KatS3mg082_1665 [Nitrospiraceae bacterium]|nr:MAG: hypothetical protein KatS3mg082_1665 [Nitrospiraceae bacterium]
MFVTATMVGESRRKEPSLSSASATRRSPRPRRAWLPSAFTLPPMTIVGSSPPCASTLATIEVVVVLPCAPAIAMPYFNRISSASISARGMTGIFLALASTTSGLVGATAEEITTTCASPTLDAWWPMKMRPPSSCSRLVVSDSWRSEPVTL